MNTLATFFRESRLARFLIPGGLFIIIFGIIMYSINIKNQNYIETESIVSNVVQTAEGYTDTDGEYVQPTYDVTVKYTVNDQEYENVLSNVGEYKVGDKLKIYYDPSDPNQITQTISLVLPIILMAAGGVMLVGGIFSAINAIKKQKALKEQEKGWKNE